MADSISCCSPSLVWCRCAAGSWRCSRYCTTPPGRYPAAPPTSWLRIIAPDPLLGWHIDMLRFKKGWNIASFLLTTTCKLLVLTNLQSLVGLVDGGDPVHEGVELQRLVHQCPTKESESISRLSKHIEPKRVLFIFILQNLNQLLSMFKISNFFSLL